MIVNSFENIWQKAILKNNVTLGQVIRNLNEVPTKIVLVVNEVGILQGTISDGDIRRGLIRGLDLDSPIATVIHRNALVVPPELGRNLVLQLMITNKIWQIPIVDRDYKVVGLHLWDEVAGPTSRSNLMVIMAGGRGTRMHPHTENCPKPLLPIAGRPMLEHIIERAKLEGFSRFLISIGYLGHMIEAYFGNGDSLSVRIDYLREESPLGTAGALSLLEPQPDAPFVVANGDVISDIRYSELIDFHVRHSSSATMAVRVHEWQHPFGVVQTEGIKITGFEEKPITKSYINAGIYVLNPSVINYLTVGECCDMPTLFGRLKVEGQHTIAYPMHEPWLDVGRPDDLVAANNT